MTGLGMILALKREPFRVLAGKLVKLAKSNLPPFKALATPLSYPTRVRLCSLGLVSLAKKERKETKKEKRERKVAA